MTPSGIDVDRDVHVQRRSGWLTMLHGREETPAAQRVEHQLVDAWIVATVLQGDFGLPVGIDVEVHGHDAMNGGLTQGIWKFGHGSIDRVGAHVGAAGRAGIVGWRRVSGRGRGWRRSGAWCGGMSRRCLRGLRRWLRSGRARWRGWSRWMWPGGWHAVGDGSVP